MSHLGRVSADDREAMRRQGLAHYMAGLDGRAPGTLAAALEAMGQIERQLGVRPRDHAEAWPDFESHMAYIEAVHRKMGRRTEAFPDRG